MSVPELQPDILRERLRAWRRELAKAQGMPPYVILHDATIDAASHMVASLAFFMCPHPAWRQARE